MVIPDLMNPLFPPIYAGAEATLGGVGYAVVIAESKEDSESESRTIEALLDRRVDGLIVASSRLDSSPPPLLEQQGIPTVLVNRSMGSHTFPAIVGDDNAGIGLVVKHLVSLGHKNIGHVAGPRNLSTGLGTTPGICRVDE